MINNPASLFSNSFGITLFTLIVAFLLFVAVWTFVEMKVKRKCKACGERWLKAFLNRTTFSGKKAYLCEKCYQAERKNGAKTDKTK